MFFQNSTETLSATEKAVHVYLDSSGSMSDEIVDFVVALLLGSGGVVSQPVYLFASKIKPVGLKQLKAGFRLSGGTSINKVLDHAREKKFKRFIVVTDGYVENISSVKKNYLETADMFVVFENSVQSELSYYAVKSWSGLRRYIKNGEPVGVV